MLDLDDLEAKAKAATSGTWEAKEVWHAARLNHADCAITALFWEDTSKGGVHRRRLDPDHDGQFLLSDAEFIAAANPATTLNLIRELREARAAVAAEREACADAESDAGRLALELECLLQSISDMPTVSRWWDSANEALDLHRSRLDAIRARGAKGGE